MAALDGYHLLSPAQGEVAVAPPGNQRLGVCEWTAIHGAQRHQ